MQQLLDSTRVSLESAFDTLADKARRQQHLYSATIAVLIALVVFTGIVLAALETDQHLSRQQNQASRYAATLSERLESEAAFVKRSILSVRRYREAGPAQMPDAAAMASVRATGVARVADPLAKRDYYLLATAATRHAWGPSLPAQLARLQQIALDTLATQQAFGLDHPVYVLSLEDDSAAVLARRRAAAQATTPIRPALIDALRDAITQALLDRTGHAVPHGDAQVWAGPIRDPLTGTMAMLSIAAAYSGDTPTFLLAACVPVGDFLAQLDHPADTALLALLNPADEAIDVAAPALPVQAPVIRDAISQARRQPRNLSHYTRRGVLMVQPLKPAFGTLVCFVPYGLLVPALAPGLAVILGVGLLLIGAIVLIARYWDRQLLRRTHSEAARALEQQLRSAQQATEAMMRARSRFFAAMSHEIRTPLNALIGNLELLARSPGLESHAPRLQALGTAAEGLRRIVNDILDFSKIDAGKLQLFSKPFRLADALESLALTYAPMATERGIRFSLQLEPQLDREVCGDRMRLTQVVNNLLNNAFKFTTSGRITLSGSYGPDALGRPMLTCRVSDSGIGMPPALAERVFQPFVQGDAVATSRHGGTGLGLSICARLCELMGGSIGVQSVQDVGSAFTIAVPLPPAGDDAATANRPDAVPARRGSVMVLCPDTKTGECLEAWLATASWRTHLLASPAAAREHLESHPPRVIVATEEYHPEAFAALQALSAAPVVWLTPDGPHRPRQRAPGIFEVTSFSHDALLASVASAAAGPQDGSAPSPSAGDPGQPAAPAWRPLPDITGLDILVAEDNPLNQAVIGEQLRALGCRPIITDNGKQALAVAESTHVDAVLTDIHMPLMNGYALLDALRALHPDLPVLAFSALAQQEQAEDWQQRGFSGYITKPASLRELGEALQALRALHARKLPDTCADQERYTRLLREQLQTDLPELAQILAARDLHALQAWTHRAASGFRIVLQTALHARCRAVEQLCLGSRHWSPAIAEAGEALQALALRYASEGPAAAAPDSP